MRAKVIKPCAPLVEVLALFGGSLGKGGTQKTTAVFRQLEHWSIWLVRIKLRRIVWVVPTEICKILLRSGEFSMLW